jgi:hypothetical protein
MAGWLNYTVPIFLLALSNLFMTTAWYWHLKFPGKPIMLVILISWGLAFIEYCVAVPANRIGYQVYNAAELKTIQEVLTLIIFVAFSVLYLGEKLNWQHMLGFAVMGMGAWLIFTAGGKHV